MITIIDYGMGNLKSVYNSLKKVNFDCQISSEVTDIEMADKLILPGVGAFKDAMDNLQNLDLILPIRKKVNDGCPLLGICLGMQMLFEEGIIFPSILMASFNARPTHLKIPSILWWSFSPYKTFMCSVIPALNATALKNSLTISVENFPILSLLNPASKCK